MGVGVEIVIDRCLIFAQILVDAKRVRVGTGLDIESNIDAGIRRFTNFERIYAVFTNLCIPIIILKWYASEL